jgi:hypothetical protein
MQKSLALSFVLFGILIPNTSYSEVTRCIDIDSKDWFAKNEKTERAHTKLCHIDPKESDLIKRVKSGIQGCPKQPVTSAFRNLTVARTLIRETIVQNTQKIKAWFLKEKIGGNSAFNHSPRQSRPAGISVMQKNDQNATRGKACKDRDYICEDVKKVTVVLRKLDKDRCFILTAYPKN